MRYAACGAAIGGAVLGVLRTPRTAGSRATRRERLDIAYSFEERISIQSRRFPHVQENPDRLLLAAVLFGFAACAKKTTKIVIATDATWPPMEMVDESKNIVGFDIDLMNAAAKAGGFEVEFKNTAWDGIFAGLEGGKYDAVMSSVTITDERKQTMDFSVPYINAGQILVVKSEVSGVETLADLDGQDRGRPDRHHRAPSRSTRYADVKKKEYDEIGLAFADLANGRIDGVVCDTPVAAQYALQNDEYKGTLKIVGEPFTDEFYGVAVKKGNKKVLDTINKGLKKVLDSGDNKAIEDEVAEITPSGRPGKSPRVKVEIRHTRIEVTDGALIPDRAEKTIFSAWNISFFGAIALLVILPARPPEAVLGHHEVHPGRHRVDLPGHGPLDPRRPADRPARGPRTDLADQAASTGSPRSTWRSSGASRCWPSSSTSTTRWPSSCP